MTDRNMPPTTQIVKNLAEEIAQKEVGKNWTAGFVKRHKKKLKSVYLQRIEKQRIMSKYAPSYVYFYSLVSTSNRLLFCL